MTRRRVEIAVGFCFAIFSLIFYFISPYFVSRGLAENYSPYEYAQWLCVLIFGLSIVYIISEFSNKKDEIFVFVNKNTDFLRVLLIILLCGFYTIIFESLGFVLSSIIFLGFFCYLGKLNLKYSLIVSIFLPLILFYIFYFSMEVRLPVGFIESLFFTL